MVTYQEWKRDQDSYRKLQELADRICQEIVRGRLQTESELEQRAHTARKLCEELFPDRLELFELIYQSRFKRLWRQFRPGI